MLIDYKIVLSIIILLCVLFLYFHYNRPDYLAKLKADLFQRSHQKFIEGFTSSPDLIKNGSFEHGLDIDDSHQKKGINSVIKLKNPSTKSEYVLEQSSKSVFYMFKVPVKNGKNYVLTYWIGKNSDWNGKDKNFNILDGKKIHSTDGTLVKSKKIATIEWKKYKYQFKAESEELEIYLGYKSDATRGNRYFTDVQLTQEISGDQSGFPKSIRGSLQRYVNFQDSKSFTPTSLVIKDLSGNGGNIKVKSKISQNTDGSILLKEQLLGALDTMSELTFAISFTGVPGESSDINLFTCGRFQINVSGDFTNISIKSDQEEKTYFGVLTDRNTIVITYNGKEVVIYVNGKQAFKEPMENNGFKLSGLYSVGPGDIDLYSFAILNKVLNQKQVSSLTTYLSGYKEGNKGVLGKMMAEDIPNVENLEKEGFRGDIAVDNLLGTEDNAFIRDHDNSAQRGINGSWHERGNKHDLSDCLDDYHKEIERHGGEKDGINIFDIRSCRKACDVEGMKTHPFCKTIDGINREKRCKNDHCPTAYLSGEDYMIYIRPGSKFAEKIGRSGNFNYGQNRRRAREIYLHNFPGCPVPDLLTPHGYVPNMDECPFLVDEMNPCKEDVCRGANWRERDVRNQGLSKRCRRSISNYCDKFKYKDEACSCWRPRNKGNPKCVELRDYVDNLEDKCRIDVFKIEDHPDMKNYVRKDEIPCWGCKL